MGGAMNPAAVAEELATGIAAATELRPATNAADIPPPPFVVVDYPDKVNLLSPGVAQIDLTATVGLAGTSERAAWAAIGEYAASSGDKSVIAALYALVPTTYSAIQVTGTRVGKVTYNDTDYFGAVLSVSVWGSTA